MEDADKWSQAESSTRSEKGHREILHWEPDVECCGGGGSIYKASLAPRRNHAGKARVLGESIFWIGAPRGR